MITRAFIILLASVGPLAFPLAQLGYTTLHDLAFVALLPSVAALAAVWLTARRHRPEVAEIVARGIAAGAIATLALERSATRDFGSGSCPATFRG